MRFASTLGGRSGRIFLLFAVVGIFLGLFMLQDSFVRAQEGEGEGEGCTAGTTIIYVDMLANGNNDGTSWADAFAEIQAGIDAAFAVNGGEVWVARGLYGEERSDEYGTGALILKSNVHVYGGFTGVELCRDERDAFHNTTLISGGSSRGGNAAYHVVEATSITNAILDGFVVGGGVADTSPENIGGGVYLENVGTDATLSNLFIFQNMAEYGGGVGMVSASPSIINCRVIQNYGDNGAGIYLVDSSPQVSNVEILFNTSSISGAAIYAGGNVGGIFSNLTIMSNVGPADSDSVDATSVSTGSLGLQNSILWDSEDLDPITGAFGVNYSIGREEWAGTGNHQRNPLFRRYWSTTASADSIMDYSTFSSTVTLDTNIQSYADHELQGSYLLSISGNPSLILDNTGNTVQYFFFDNIANTDPVQILSTLPEYGSPAIDSGTSNATVNIDIEGNLRGDYTTSVIGSGGVGDSSFYDIGAVENTGSIGEVPIPDAGLYNALVDYLGLTSGDSVLASQLYSLNELYASDYGIVDLDGLEFCVTIEDLQLNNNDISDLGALWALPNLAQIEAMNNLLTDIDIAPSLPSLTSLALGTVMGDGAIDLNFSNRNSIPDLSPLSGLTQLSELALAKLECSDISALANLDALTVLDLHGNGIEDISVLSDMEQLYALMVGGNPLDNGDMSVIANKQNLIILEVSSLNIDNLDFIGSSPLWFFIAENTQVSDFTALQNHFNLGSMFYADIYNNPYSQQAACVQIPAIEEGMPTYGTLLHNAVCTDYILTIDTTGNGTTSPSGALTYPPSSDAIVTAIADAGWEFDSWTGDISGATLNGTEITVPMTGNKSITANFTEEVPTLVTFTQEVLGGTYLPGDDITLRISITKSGPDNVVAMDLSDTLPQGWFLKQVLSGPSGFTSSTNLNSFSLDWTETPVTLPIIMDILIETWVATDGTQTLSAVGNFTIENESPQVSNFGASVDEEIPVESEYPPGIDPCLPASLQEYILADSVVSTVSYPTLDGGMVIAVNYVPTGQTKTDIYVAKLTDTGEVELDGSSNPIETIIGDIPAYPDRTQEAAAIAPTLDTNGGVIGYYLAGRDHGQYSSTFARGFIAKLDLDLSIIARQGIFATGASVDPVLAILPSFDVQGDPDGIIVGGYIWETSEMPWIAGAFLAHLDTNLNMVWGGRDYVYEDASITALIDLIQLYDANGDRDGLLLSAASTNITNPETDSDILLRRFDNASPPNELWSEYFGTVSNSELPSNLTQDFGANGDPDGFIIAGSRNNKVYATHISESFDSGTQTWSTNQDWEYYPTNANYGNTQEVFSNPENKGYTLAATGDYPLIHLNENGQLVWKNETSLTNAYSITRNEDYQYVLTGTTDTDSFGVYFHGNDLTPPDVHFVGTENTILDCGEEVPEGYVLITDNCDEPEWILLGDLINDQPFVNNTLTYVATDDNGNESQRTLYVDIEGPTCPDILVTIAVEGAGASVGPFIGSRFFYENDSITLSATEVLPMRFDRITANPPINGISEFYFPEETFTITEDVTFTVHFVPLDYEAEMADWVNFWGSGDVGTLDINGLDVAGGTVVPNGIADIAEFALFQHILLTPSHPQNSLLVNAWYANRNLQLASLATQTASCSPNPLNGGVLSAIATYTLLGGASSISMDIHFENRMNTLGCPVALPSIFLTANTLSPYLNPNADLDGDGFTNLEEWQWAWAGFAGFEEQVTDFIAHAENNTLSPAEEVEDPNDPEASYASIIITGIVGEGTIYPPVGTHTYKRFISADPLCPNAENCEEYQIRVAAEPAPGWIFWRWRGETTPQEARLTVGSNQPHTMIAEFIERPGLEELDLVEDLGFALEEWGEYTALYPFAYDKNKLVHGVNGQPDTFMGNGIPDGYEVGLLQAILQDVNLDLSRNSGVVHSEIWEMWQENIAQAELDLPVGTDGRIVRALAAYLSIGDQGSVAWAEYIAQREYSVTLNPEDYGDYEVFLAFDENADNDTAVNLSEWQGSGFFNPFEEHLANYLGYALDSEVQGEGLPDSGGSGGEDCESCIPEVNVELFSIGSGTATGSSGYSRLGETLTVKAEASGLGWEFVQWMGGGMLNTSREPVDDFPLMPQYDTYGNLLLDQYVGAFFSRQSMKVCLGGCGWPDVQVIISLVDGEQDVDMDGNTIVVACPFEPVRMKGKMAWDDTRIWNTYGSLEITKETHEPKIRWYLGSDKGAVWTDDEGEISVLPSETLSASIEMVPKGGMIEVSGSSNKGGIVLVAANYGWAPPYTGKAKIKSDAVAPINYYPVPYPGYVFTGWDPPITNGVPIAHPNFSNSAHAKFEKKNEATLKIKVEGCGYVTADPATKYYGKGTVVQLTAVNSKSMFSGWSDNVNSNPKFANNSFTLFENSKVTAKFEEPDFSPSDFELFPVCTHEYGGHVSARWDHLGGWEIREYVDFDEREQDCSGSLNASQDGQWRSLGYGALNWGDQIANSKDSLLPTCSESCTDITHQELWFRPKCDPPDIRKFSVMQTITVGTCLSETDNRRLVTLIISGAGMSGYSGSEPHLCDF